MQHDERRDSSRVIAELRAMHEIARREHGPQGRSTRRIHEALLQAEQEERRPQREAGSGSAREPGCNR